MKVGITYDLREDYLSNGFGEEETAEFDRIDTIESIDQALRRLGYDTERVGNIQGLTRRLVGGHRWDIVFNIAEGVKGFGREAQVPALLDAYDIPYTFSDPMVLSLTLHKAMAKRVVRDLGVATPDFCVVEKASDIDLIDMAPPLFVKPVAEGTGKGITSASKIIRQSQLSAICRGMLSRYMQPVLVERFLPGQEFTVGIVGSGENAVAIGVMEVLLRENAESDVYSYLNKERCEELVNYRLVSSPVAERAKEAAVKAWKGLGCLDAGRVDLRVDANGVPNFLEVNPLAGLHPEHSDLCIIAGKVGMTYQDLIHAIMASAIARYSLEKRSHAAAEYWNPLQQAHLPREDSLGIIYRRPYTSGSH